MNCVTGKQMLRDTLTGRQATMAPSAPLYMGLYCEPLWRGKLVEVYREMAANRARLTLSFDALTDAHLEAWDRTWALFQAPPDWMRTRWGINRSQAEGSSVALTRDACIWTSADGKTSVDYLAPYSATTSSSVDIWDRDVPLSTVTDVEALVPLQTWESWLEDGRATWIERSLGRWGDRHLIKTTTGAPFWGAYSILGFSGLMHAVKQQPAMLEKLLERLLHNRMEYIRAVAEVGVPCLFIEECFSSADIISEADFARLAWPMLRDMIAYAADLGLLTVFYYCGQIEGRVPYLAQSAANALAFEEEKKNIKIDLAEIRSVVGPEKTIFGNLDVTSLRDASREKVHALIAEQARAAGAPFVASVGSPVIVDTPPERVSWVTEAARSLSLNGSAPNQSNS
jgi:hypothetical protein